MSLRSSLFLVVVVTVGASTFLGGCNTTNAAANSDTRQWSLVKSTASDDVAQFAEDFYAEAGTAAAPYAAFRLRAEAMLKAHPDSGVVHEVLAYDARLRADEDASWDHWMHALADTAYDAAPVALYELMVEPRTPAQSRQMRDLFAKLQIAHPSPLVREQALVAQQSIEARLGNREALVDNLRRRHFISGWNVLGALDNDQGKGFLTPYPPEGGVDLGATLPGRRSEIRWRQLLPEGFEGEQSLGSQVSPSGHSIAYLVNWLHHPKAIDAMFRVDTSAAIRVWVNGKLVLSEENVSQGAIDGLAAPIKLAAGWNEILVKSASETGQWVFSARVTDSEGLPLQDATLSSQRPTGTAPVAVQKETTPQPARVFLVDEHPLKTSQMRAAFLGARMLRRAGLMQRVALLTQAMTSKEPSSIVLYERALALWDNDEMGKALDMLNAGVERNGDLLGAFLVKRARFYRTKRLWDKALADLQRTTGDDKHAIIAEMDLAGIYGARGWKLAECAHYEKLLQRWPQHGWILRSRARCLQDRGRLDDTRETLEQARALEPGHSNTLSSLSDIYAIRGDHARAWELHETLMGLQPQSIGNLVKAARLKRIANDFEGARHYLTQAHAQDPDWEQPLEDLGELAYEAGDVEKALELWRMAIDRNPDDTRLADLVDYLAPESLGVIERYIPTDDVIEAAIARGNSHTPARGANVAMLLDHEVTEVFQDGSARAVVTVVRRALNKQGRDQMIQTNLPRAGKVKLLRATAVSPEGRVQEASSVNGGVVRFRNVNDGTTTVVQYIHNRPPQRFLPNHFVSMWFFEGVATEYLDSTWVLMMPDQRPLNIEVVGDGISQDKIVDGDLAIRTFKSKDRAPFFGEPGMPSLVDLLAHVSVSTVEGWEEYVRWERALLKNAFTSNPQLVALSEKLVGDEKDPKKKLDLLFHYVAEEIRYQQDYENTIAGVRPHACPVVLERGYGDCKDKAVLLILLAKHQGIDVDFAILRTRSAGKVRREIPNQQFNHAIVFVPKQAGIDAGFFLDPTTDGLDMGSLRSDDQGATSLVLDPDTGSFAFREIPYQSPAMETEEQKIVVTIGRDLSARAVINGAVRGDQGSQLRRILRSDETAKKVFGAITGALFSGGTLTDYSTENGDNIWKPVTFHVDADVSAAIQPMADAKRMRVPETFSLVRTTRLQERQHPLVLGVPSTSAIETEFKLPPGATFSLEPSPFRVEHPCFTHTRTVQRRAAAPRSGEGPALVVKDQTIRTCVEISPEDYAGYRKATLDVMGRLQDPIAFKLGGLAKAGSIPQKPTQTLALNPPSTVAP